jgi:predicted ArsR family transcriptional regulator
MATMQQQARALGDPTRHGLFRYIATSEQPVDVAELTDHFGFNHNAIRQHLAKLVDADLVVEERAPASGPGRPRLLYSMDPAVDSRWGVSGPYERLSLLLTEIIRSGDGPREVGRRAGRQLREGSPSDGVAQLRTAMARQGFEPEVRHRRDGPEILLQACPFESSALADPETVCQLHLGLAEGIVGDDGSVEVEELVAKDPRRANCRLELRIVNSRENDRGLDQ